MDDYRDKLPISDPRLNDFAGQRLGFIELINDYGTTYGFRVVPPDTEDADVYEIVTHEDCGCDRCRGISDVYDQLMVSDDLEPNPGRRW